MAIFHLHAGDKAQRRTFVRCCCCSSPWRCVGRSAPACAMISAARVAWSGSLTLALDNAPALGIGPGLSCGPMRPSRSAKTLNFAASSTLPCPPRTDPQQCATLARAFVQKSSLDRGHVQRLFSITSVETTPFPPDDHDARH
jgi:hypothetical protein